MLIESRVLHVHAGAHKQPNGGMQQNFLFSRRFRPHKAAANLRCNLSVVQCTSIRQPESWTLNIDCFYGYSMYIFTTSDFDSHPSSYDLEQQILVSVYNGHQSSSDRAGGKEEGILEECRALWGASERVVSYQFKKSAGVWLHIPYINIAIQGQQKKLFPNTKSQKTPVQQTNGGRKSYSRRGKYSASVGITFPITWNLREME